MAHIHYFQHVPFEGLGMIAEWIKEKGHSVSKTAFYEGGDSLPAPNEYDALIVMGGPMGVYDEAAYPWLNKEKDHIRTAIEAGKNVLGICLGAQLIADVLGAAVKPHQHKEIGWFPIAFSDDVIGHSLLNGLNNAMSVLHWHGDRFEIPNGALPLASSQACDNQGFLYKNNVIGLQFHLEMDKESIQNIIDACGDELSGGQYIQDAETITQKTLAAHTKRVLFALLNNWLALKVSG